jgi:hypothetical protein
VLKQLGYSYRIPKLVVVFSQAIFSQVKYQPDQDCVECVKDLIRFLRRDDENHEVSIFALFN